MRVLHVCSEIFPLLKTGGLADVTAALPPELDKEGCDVRMLVPGFPEFKHGIFDQHLVAELPAKFGARSVKLMFGKMPDTRAFPSITSMHPISMTGRAIPTTIRMDSRMPTIISGLHFWAGAPHE